MPRPTKWRRVSFIPGVRYFLPSGLPQKQVKEVVLKIEELEAIRLKDLEGLEQEACAENMEVSRPTFQRILMSAREKVTDALVNGKAIKIEGGNFTSNICPVQCRNCGHKWDESFENFKKIQEGNYICSECGSKEVICNFGEGRKFCGGSCWRHRGSHK